MTTTPKQPEQPKLKSILIKGKFDIVGKSPDGDSVRFKADNKNIWVKFKPEGISPEKDWKEWLMIDADESLQLRLRGIDALETHYNSFSQPTKLGRLATNSLINFAGLKEREFDWEKSGFREFVTSKTAKTLTGYIVVDGMDTKNKRPLAWVFKGIPDKLKDGDVVTIQTLRKIVRDSANFLLLQQGLVYPSFYSDLDVQLLSQLTNAAEQARKKKSNIWKYDKTLTMKGAKVSTLQQIMNDEVLMYPKLFRGIVDICTNGESKDNPKDVPIKLDDLKNGIVISENKIKRTVPPQTIRDAIEAKKGNYLRMKKKPWEIFLSP